MVERAFARWPVEFRLELDGVRQLLEIDRLFPVEFGLRPDGRQAIARDRQAFACRVRAAA